jgi:hypothetical protein
MPEKHKMPFVGNVKITIIMGLIVLEIAFNIQSSDNATHKRRGHKMNQTIINNIPSMLHCCGYYATMRWIVNQTGHTMQTAMRCIQAVKFCEAVKSI